MNAQGRIVASRFLSILCFIALLPALCAQTPPQLVSVTPAIGETNAAPRDSVVFVFDQAMDLTPLLTTAGAIVGNYQFTPINAQSGFTGSWSADRKTLTFVRSLSLALNTEVTWTLNPAGATLPLKSVGGVPLATTTGVYKIAQNSGGSPSETCPPVTPAPGTYVLTKSIQYTQTGPDVVTFQVNAGIFGGSITSPSAGPAVTNASVTLPDGTIKNFVNQLGAMRFTQLFTNEAGIEAAFPPGPYTLRFIQAGDIQQTIPLTMPATAGVIPKIANYIEAQRIDPSQDFTLRWNAFDPQGADAIVRVAIVDEFGNRIFLAPNACVPRTLDSTATSVVIPAGYLRPGFVYNAQLIFTLNYHKSSDIPDMTGNGFVQRSTAFSIKAVAPGTPPSETCDVGTAVGGSYTLLKSIIYHQTAADQVTLQPGKPALFSATVQSPTFGAAVTNGSLTLPNAATQALTNQQGIYYSLSGLFDTPGELETAYPPGAYTLRFKQTGLAERVVEMTVAETPASIPTIENVAEGQAIDPTKPFTLKWNALSPQVAGSFIRLIVSDSSGKLVFMAPNVCIPRDLDSAATSIVIPTNYFKADTTYQGQLMFGTQFYQSTDTNGMVGYGAVQRTLLFELKTAGGSVVVTAPARFTGFLMLANGHPKMDLSGSANKVYVIQRSGSLLNPIWNPLGNVTMNSAGTGVFEDVDASLQLPAYYQAVGN